jgi:TadE-like protein
MKSKDCLERLRLLVHDCSGQTLLETALVLPLLLVTCLAVVEVGLAIRQEQSVTTLSREGANLISRDTTLEDAATTLASMSGGPVDLSTNARVIFSVLKRGTTTGTTNYGRLVLYERYEYGSYSSVTSRLSTRGTATFGTDPDHLVATNSDTDANLQVTNAPASLLTADGGLIYVAEVFSLRPLLTPLNRFGVTVPQQLYSIAYF